MLAQALCQSFSAHHQESVPASSLPTLTQCTKQSVQKSTDQYWKCQKQTIRKIVVATSSAPTKIYQHSTINILSLSNTQKWWNSSRITCSVWWLFTHRLVSVAASTKTSAVHTQAYTHTVYQTTSSKTSVTPPHIQQHISALKTNYLAAENTSSFTINMHQHFV